MNLAFLILAILSLIIISAIIFLCRKYIYFFNYKENNFITALIILIVIYTVSLAAIGSKEKIAYNSMTFSFLISLIASGFFYTITYINTFYAKAKDLETLLVKVARCYIFSQYIKEAQKEHDKEKFEYIISLFRHEVTTAYQMASACKPSFIPVIAVIDRFLQKLESAGQECRERTLFDSMELLHKFFTRNNLQFKSKYWDIPDYRDIDEMRKKYISIYDAARRSIESRLWARID